MTPRLATFTVFAVNGAMMGTWVAHIPWLQDHLGISKATLGLCLLCMALGALVSMPLTGHILQGRSSASVTRAATLVFCLMLPLPLLATSPIMLAAILFAVERELRRPIMSSLHGGWSVGGFLAAGLVAIAAASGVDPRLESLVVGVALWVAALFITRLLGSVSTHSEARSGFARPSRAVLLIGGLCFLAMMTEGAIGDWSGIYLRHNAGASAAAAATAFTGFSLGMAVARLGGDLLNERLGAATLMRGGMALVAVALGGVLLIGETVPAVIGFAVCGLGIANAVPLLFSAAGRLDPPGPSLAATFTIGYTGFIVGPPLIGLLADRFGLPTTLALLVIAALAVAALGGRAAATKPALSSPDADLPTVVPELDAAIH
jgi:predicted MFS family arabinose efflux permease